MAALVSLVLMLGLLWLLLVRPQQRQMRARQAVIRSLQLGDEVVTAGGIFGTIVAMDDAEVQLQVAPGTVLRVMRGAVNRRAEEVVPALDAGEDDFDEAETGPNDEVQDGEVAE
jgi:preprotein translocase subunit YajC